MKNDKERRAWITAPETWEKGMSIYLPTMKKVREPIRLDEAHYKGATFYKLMVYSDPWHDMSYSEPGWYLRDYYVEEDGMLCNLGVSRFIDELKKLEKEGHT